MKHKVRFAFQAAIIAAFAILSACSKQEEPRTFSEPVLSALEVSIAFDALEELPEESVIYVRLEDVTNGIDNSIPLVEFEASDLAESPYNATLQYDQNLISEGSDYRLTATLLHEGKPLGDTAILRDPFDGKPLAMGVYELPLGAQSSYNTLTLLGPFWVLKSMEGTVLEVNDPRQRPNIQLSIGSESYSGFAGCNRYTGTYSLDGTRINLGGAAVTKMYCEQMADLEQTFLAMLEGTGRWRMDGPELVFGDTDGGEIARFQAYAESKVD